MVKCPFRCIALIVLLIVPSLSVHAGTFTLQQVLGSPFPYGLVAASHAPRIAWVFNAKGSRNVWIAEGPNFAARQVTHYSGDDGEPIASLRLTPDGRTVVYVRGTEIKQARPGCLSDQRSQSTQADGMGNGCGWRVAARAR